MKNKDIVDVKEVRCICEFATECPQFEMGLCKARVKLKEEELKKIDALRDIQRNIRDL